MENKDDYLTEYRKFFEHFAETVNPKEQLPVKLGSYKFINLEVVGGIIDWTTQYLTEKKCPKSLLAPLIKIVIDEVRGACKKHPVVCGFNPSDDAYEPLKLMQSVITKTNEICLRYLDNSMLCSLPPPGAQYNLVTTCAVKNSRRRMEDRHVIIHDLNTIFNNQEASPSSYYAVFDGHAGHDAAAYSAAHLHQFLAESKHFASNPEQALKDAFCKTDALFLEKCKVENFSSGTTAVCALHRPKEKSLYIAWVGDSQAVIANQGKYFQCVVPHRPSREDEKLRIEESGGVVMFWGSWRVSGQLAVSRAIGDADYKPFVTAEPDIQEVVLNGTEDFLVIACDGLWDFVKDFDAVKMVYQMIYQNPEDIDSIPQRLVQFSKQQGSLDNISVIVVFFREPSKIAAESHWVSSILRNMEAGLDNANTANNPFANSNGADILTGKDDFLLGFGNAFKTNGASFMESMEHAANGNRGFEDVEDLGPETDVDAVDDGMLSPVKEVSLENAYSMSDFEEKVAMEIDANYQKMEGEKTPREETPTPPVEEVHDGLVDNVAESEDSEDEWNYIKGEEEAKVSVQSQQDQEVADINSSAENDTMSQLNPHAAEFVPISPTRSIESPIGSVLKDEIISQSPRKGREIDINVPEIQDFVKDVKNCPSETLNGHENNQKLSSQEIMENLLNGKNLDEIEFQPGGTPTKSAIQGDEFHFGPNATPFSTPGKFLDQSEAQSTKATFGDESIASYMNETTLDNTSNPFGDTADFVSFEKQDAMSMSFYQDKDDDTDPFDLNKVQVLPENVDEFIGNTTETNKTEVVTTDLDLQNDMEMLGIYELPKSPDLKIKTPEPTMNPLEPEERNTPDDGIAQNSEPLEDLSPEPIEQTIHSPESGYSPDLQAKSPSEFDNRVDSPVYSKSPAPSDHSIEISKSPAFQQEDQFVKTPEPSAPQYEDLIKTESSYLASTQGEVSNDLINDEAIEEDFTNMGDVNIQEAQEIAKVEENSVFESHNLIHEAEVHEPVSPKTGNFCFEPIEPAQQCIPQPLTLEQNLVDVQEQNIIESPVDECRITSPLNKCILKSTSNECILESPSNECRIESPSNECRLDSPIDDVTSSIKDDEPLSPIEPELHFAQEVSNAVQENVTDEISSPICEKVDEKRIEPESVEANLCEKTPEQPLETIEVMPSEQTEEVKEVGDKIVESSNAENEKDVEEVKIEAASAGASIFEDTKVIFDNDAAIELLKPIEEKLVSLEIEEKVTEQNNLSEKMTEAVALTGAAVTAMAAAASVAITKSEETKSSAKPKTGTATQAKKPAPKTATSPTKPLPPKAATAKPSTTLTKSAPKTLSKTATPAKSPIAAKAAPSPKAKTPTSKPSVANGDIKSAAAKTTTAAKKPVPAATTKTQTTAKPPATKVPATKPTVESKTTTKPATTKLSTARSTTTTSAAPKPRPSTLATKTSTTTTTTNRTSAATTTKPSSATSRSTTLPKSTSVTQSKPKPSSAPASSKPRVPLTKSLPKTADAEKQDKEAVNKMTALKSNRTASAATTKPAAKKIEPKVPSSRLTATKTSTTTAKKPTEQCKVPPIKRPTPKTTTKPKENGVPNGLSHKEDKITSINEINTELVKDISPVENNLIIENSQLPEATIAD